MATKKRSTRKSTGRKRGRPRNADRLQASEAPPPAAQPADVETMIAAATTAAPRDRSAALDALATELEQDVREHTPVITGTVHSPESSVSDKAVEQLSMQVAGLSVVLFGLMALWRGPEWALTEDQAGLIGDATAQPYAEEAAELARKVKYAGPLVAIVGIVGQKVIAETERRRAERDATPRAPGLAPSNG